MDNRINLRMKFLYHPQPERPAQSGFTLVEMSVFLVIIGLLVGGIVLGQAMIHQSEIRKTLSEVSQFRTSINAFRTQYDALPGDFKQAEEFWGDTGETDGTENGDGDKLIEFINEDGVFEGYRAWQHLGRALLVPGIYPGTTTLGAAIPGIDVPESELTGGYALESGAMDIDGQLVLLLGNPAASTTTMLMDGSLKPEDGYDIDLKVDDGDPRKGVVRGDEGENATDGSCVDDSVDPPIYDLEQKVKSCFLGFQL